MRQDDRQTMHTHALQNTLRVDYHPFLRAARWMSDVEFAQEIHLGQAELAHLKERIGRN